MNAIVVEYILFLLAAFILIWAVMALNKRISRHDQYGMRGRNRWVKLDVRRSDAREEPPASVFEDEGEDEEGTELHARASQNGHHTESQRPQI